MKPESIATDLVLPTPSKSTNHSMGVKTNTNFAPKAFPP